MFVCLWLLASMIIDALTPKELTVYMIGGVTAPAFLILAIVYWRRLPKLDFAIIFATLWMITVMVLEFITPRPLSLSITLGAIAPLVIVGCVVNYRRWRRSKSNRPKSSRPSP
jgi:phosphatidylserine synthase